MFSSLEATDFPFPLLQVENCDMLYVGYCMPLWHKQLKKNPTKLKALWTDLIKITMEMFPYELRQKV